MQVVPGRGIGFLSLGASLYDVLTRLKSEPHLYPDINVSYWPPEPLSAPVVLDLISNGLRLRFDGTDQRLRLIEVLDFSKTQMAYDGKDVVKVNELRDTKTRTPNGPLFRYVYDKLLGPSFPGEYMPPEPGLAQGLGSYVLSYPGVAFNFPLAPSAWVPEENFVTILSSSAGPASSMAVFVGTSWQEACQDLYGHACPFPRSLSLNGRVKEHQADEIDLVRISCDGKIKLLRRSSSPFEISLGETTPQDLVAELGPPDAIYTKSDRRLSIHRALNRGLASGHLQSGGQLGKYEDTFETDHSSSQNVTDESDTDSLSLEHTGETDRRPVEFFYNYFRHGFDVFISSSSVAPINRNGLPTDASHIRKGHFNRLVATKLLLHGNVPGSYPFNRYRRSRWVIDPRIANFDGIQLDSETSFAEIANTLQQVWPRSTMDGSDARFYQRGMPINRDWDSPGSSCELLGGWEDQTEANTKENAQGRNLGNGNTELFGYPGLIFEVLKNNAVSCLTVF